jgi:hypothetical protein
MIMIQCYRYNREEERERERETEKETNPVETAVHFVHFNLFLILFETELHTAVEKVVISQKSKQCLIIQTPLDKQVFQHNIEFILSSMS